MKLLRFQINHPKFPRCFYLLQSLDDVKRFLQQCFIFYQVNWSKIDNFYRDQTFKCLIDDAKEAYQTTLPEGTNISQFSDIAILREYLDKYFPWTVIPFNSTSTPNGNKRQIKINDLNRISDLEKRNQYIGAPWERNLAPGALLIEAGSRLSIKLDGKLYNTPCEMCKNLFSHIAGNCQIQDSSESEYRIRFCHMKLVWDSNVLSEDDKQQSSNIHDVCLDKL